MNYICEFVGGPKAGIMSHMEAVLTCDGFSEDLTHIRKRGGFVRRPELDNQPTFDGYLGPMWDGTRTRPDGSTVAVLRYETQEVYDMLSN